MDNYDVLHAYLEKIKEPNKQTRLKYHENELRRKIHRRRSPLLTWLFAQF